MNEPRPLWNVYKEDDDLFQDLDLYEQNPNIFGEPEEDDYDPYDPEEEDFFPPSPPIEAWKIALQSYQKKLLNYPKGSKNYNKIQRQIQRFTDKLKHKAANLDSKPQT